MLSDGGLGISKKGSSEARERPLKIAILVTVYEVTGIRYLLKVNVFVSLRTLRFSQAREVMRIYRSVSTSLALNRSNTVVAVVIVVFIR